MNIEKLKNTIQDSNLNFLIGSGLSVPYFSTLGNVETLLTELGKDKTLREVQNNYLRASILGKYFETVILKNPKIVDPMDTDANKTFVLNNYKDFLNFVNTILLSRKSSIQNKQVNLFTTNIDVFFEKALEDSQLEFNDGFHGRFSPVFSLTNFRNTLFKKSLHFDNTSEIPVFNLFKMHGSLTWKSEADKIKFSDLSEISEIKKKWDTIKSKVISFTEKDDLATLKPKIPVFLRKDKDQYREYLSSYDKLAVVNPTKEKFKDTILNLNYYELLRVFSNELEKENTILFVMGFSLADEHIREIVLRAANSNPTLMIKIFAYDSSAKENINKNLVKGNTIIRYSNIEIIAPEEKATYCYDFRTINYAVFNALLNNIG